MDERSFLTAEEMSFLLRNSIEDSMAVYQTTVLEELDVLRRVCEEVEPTDRNLEILIRKMHNTVMDKRQQGVGIAAPQIGINRRVFLAKRFDKEGEPFEFFVNPRIVWYSEVLRKGEEGCLSIANEYNAVYRSLVIQIVYYDLSGTQFQEVVEGYTAVIMQHEMDHLNGILFTDRIMDQTNRSYEDATIETALVYEV